MLFRSAAFPAEIKSETIIRKSVVKKEFLLCTGFGFRPKERTKKDRVFESFALMNSYNLNRVLIAFESQLVAVLRNAFIPSLIAQPGAKRIWRETAGALRIV